MALIFMDGFDAIDTSEIYGEKWDNVGNGATIDPANGRFGTNGLELSSHTHEVNKSFTAATTMIGGGAVWLDNLENNRTLMEFREGTTVHVRIKTGVGGSMWAELATTAIIGDVFGLPRLHEQSWHHIEVKVLTHDSAGTVEIRVDEEVVLNLSGEDTSGGGTPTIDNIQFHGTNLDAYWDDCFIISTTGNAPTNFIGDQRIDTLYPDGDGNYSEFTTATPSGTHALNVDETPPDSDTSYNETVTANHRDTFTMDNLSAITTQTIHAIQQFSFARGTAASPGNMRNKLRISGVDHDGASLALTDGTYFYLLEVWFQDPQTTAAWTEGGVNGLESGYEDL